MTTAEVKKGLLDKMKQIFPTSQYKYYSVAVKEDFDRPSFFTQLKPNAIEPGNRNTKNKYYTFYIQYMQDVVDEADALSVFDTLDSAFGLGVQIGSRFVDITNIEYDFVGRDGNILEISVDIEWTDRINRTVTEPLISSVSTNIHMEDD